MYNSTLEPTGQNLTTPDRDGEINRETRQLRAAAQEVNNLAETLLKRLDPMISPVQEKTGTDEQSSPSTPYATNLREITNTIYNANQALSFILRGLEL